VNTLPGAFDNFSSARNTYAGASAWTDNPLLPGSKVTFLSNYRKKQDARFDVGTGEDRRHTTGMRFWSEPGGAWDFSWEGGIQHGLRGQAGARLVFRFRYRLHDLPRRAVPAAAGIAIRCHERRPAMPTPAD
jgi:hypothetical protein